MELDEQERKFVDIIDEHGWHVMKVFGTGTEPPFAYTTGLWKSFGHPELISVGLPTDKVQPILNGMGLDIRDGVRRFETGGPVPGVMEGFDVYFADFDWANVKEYFGWALWYYGSYLGQWQQFPILQCVWPAKGNGSFPWSPEWPEDLKNRQPILGVRPPTAH